MRSPERTHASLWFSFVIFAAAFGTVWADVSGEITGVKFQSDDKRIVIESTGTLGKHLARVIGKPNRVVMDFADAKVGKVPAKIAGNGQVSEIRVGNVKSRARIVVDFQDHPVPPFHVRRDDGRILVIFGNPLLPGGGTGDSQAMDTKKSEPGAAQKAATVPVPVSASGSDSKGAFGSPAGQGTLNDQGIGRPVAEARTSAKGSSAGGKNPVAAAGKAAPSGVKEDSPGMKQVKLAQRMDSDRPPSSPMGPGPDRVGNRPPNYPLAHSGAPSAQGPVSPGGQMVREVRPPVTPPTPDPRLLVQDITELKFVQVGHNARLIVRGGDHLDYRLIKVSPTKLKIDLINAEIPKVHQKPLRTDQFSTSVEMIVPGSQTIFVQLKDSVPHQVEKQKGVLMIDFPPPRFQMTSDQKTTRKPTDTGARDAFQQAGETRREAVRVMKEEEILKTNDARRKSIESLQKQQEDLDKQRSELTKRYRVTPDPAIFSKPVTMDFQGISLKNAFRLLAEQAGINIILDDKVTGSTTLRLFQVPLGQVIDTILSTHDLDREMVGNVMRVGRRTDIKKLKDERQKEYADRLKEVDKRFTDIRNELQKNQGEIEKNLKELEKVETGEAVPTEDIRAEEVGEAGCIKLKGEDVCFYYATVKLVYAKPDDIVKTLRCMFNLDCPGAKTLGQSVNVGQQIAEAATESGKARDEYEKQLREQGFYAGSAGYDARIQQYDRTQSEKTRATAATAQAAAVATGPQAGGQLTLPYGTDEDLAKIIAYSMLWPDDKNRMIFIKDTYERIAQIKKVIYALDVPVPQVLIESRLVQAIRGWSRGLGIRWGGKNNQTGFLYGNLSRQNFWSAQGTGSAAQMLTPGATDPPRPNGTEPASQFLVDLPAVAGVLMGAGINFGLLATNYVTELDARLSIGEATNKTKIISRPKVQVMDNEKALIKNGLSIPYVTTGLGGSTQTQMIDADLKLEVKPKIYVDGRIKMDIKVTDDEPEIVSGTLSIRRRQAETLMIVKDGETAVIGGIIRSNDGTNRGGWPGLMNVPLLNLLFSNKSTSNNIQELLVFITPIIVKRPPAAS